jgi:hypothetical protein
MLYSDQEIERIHALAKAIEGRSYISRSNKRYIGLSNGRLKLIDPPQQQIVQTTGVVEEQNNSEFLLMGG